MPQKTIDGITLHVQDLLRSWRRVSARRMFGGIGLFTDGLMFGLVIDEVVYLKETFDEQGKPLGDGDFTKEYFEYETKKGVGRLYYYRLPESALDNGDYMAELANESLKSAQSEARKKSRKKTEHK